MTNSASNAINVHTVGEETSSSDEAVRVFVDFDHTLLRSNSTQEFLRTARPFSLIWPIFSLISLTFKLFRLSERTRFVWEDALKVSLALMINPGILQRFEKQAANIAKRRLNEQVVQRLRDVPRAQITIVSFGYLPIIRALLKDTSFETCEIIAPSFRDIRSARREGKISMLEQHGIIPTAHDVLYSDNLVDDADLAACVGTVVEVKADHDSYVYPQPYFPFFYTAKIKRDPRFFVKQVLLEELPIVLLAFGLTTLAFDPGLWAGLIMLFLAMILSYELGYAENDRVGARKEAAPKLTKNFFRYRAYKMLPHAWIFAGIFTVIGVAALGSGHMELAMQRLGLRSDLGYWVNLFSLSALWMAVMATARLVFYAFNHAPLLGRVYLYAPLHIVKYLGLIVLLPISAVGLLLVYAHIVRTWSLYAIRRAGGDIHFLCSQSVRTIFLMFGLGLMAYMSPELLLNWQTLIIVLFCVVRSMPELMRKQHHSTQNRHGRTHSSI